MYRLLSSPTMTDAVDELRQTILQLAVQGRLTDQTPDDELAEVLMDVCDRLAERLQDAETTGMAWCESALVGAVGNRDVEKA